MILMANQISLSSVKALIRQRLPERYPKIEHVAPLLGMPVRTLQRHLQRSGFSYSALVEETRFELACRLLDEPHAQVAAVAKALSYTDQSSFSRAFRRWSGMSPRAYRRRDQQSRSRSFS